MSAALRSRALPQILAGGVAVLSAAGLLCMRLGVYDESSLLVGARLARAGRLPYRDFYTYYGPFGYTVQGLFFEAAANPGLAFRIGQAFFLLGASFFIILLARRPGETSANGWGALLSVLALSSTARFASFFAFGFAVACLVSFAMAEGSRTGISRARWAAASGILLAMTALTRPAFGLYVGGSIVLIQGVGASAERGRRDGLIGAVAGGASLLLIWTLLYREIPPGEALEATLIVAGRLVAAGGRYLEAPFLRASLPIAFLSSVLLIAPAFVWAMVLNSRRTKVLVTTCIAAGSIVPLWLRTSAEPARDSVLVAGAIVGLVFFVAFSERAALRASPRLRAAALFGLTAAAFTHYFWSRPDRPHAFPFLTLAAGSAALVFDRLRMPARIASFGLLLLFSRGPEDEQIPLEILWRGGARRVAHSASMPGARLRSIWPCGEVPSDAAQAVALADGGADRSSRFVAVGSSQSETDRDPILLFLLSSRLPYTKWYTYDPGLQSSPQIQREMVRELEQSGSRTAVVWRAELFSGADRTVERRTRGPFDTAVDRLYPATIGRFGAYEVRAR